MKICPKFHVRKRTLLSIGGTVWIIAGFNVARLGLLSYGQMASYSGIHFLLSAIVFAIFGFMFYKMSSKHSKRIFGFQEASRPVWHFFDLKSYLIMAFMMGGGIWLRSSGIAPIPFIAVFYTGLGCALTLAGVFFWYMYFRVEE